MAKKETKAGYKKFLIFLSGLFVLILGITLCLLWFDQVVVFFKGITGIVLALSGLFTLYSLSKL